MIQKFIDWLIARAERTPYEHIGDYMERWWLVPYNRLGIACRLHHILRSDDERAFHDHPWLYLTIILRGGYFEIKPVYDRSGLYIGTTRQWYGPGSFILRRAKSWHRLEIRPNHTAWTLFITGPKRQSWGFMIQPNNKTYWREYLNDYRIDVRAQEDVDSTNSK